MREIRSRDKERLNDVARSHPVPGPNNARGLRGAGRQKNDRDVRQIGMAAIPLQSFPARVGSPNVPEHQSPERSGGQSSVAPLQLGAPM